MVNFDLSECCSFFIVSDCLDSSIEAQLSPLILIFMRVTEGQSLSGVANESIG